MKILKRELATATRNLCTLMGDETILKQIEKWNKKEMAKRPDFVNLGYVFINPDLAVVACLDKEESDKIEFILYEPFEDKQYDYVALWDQKENLTEVCYTILYDLLKGNKIGVYKIL